MCVLFISSGERNAFLNRRVPQERVCAVMLGIKSNSAISTPCIFTGYSRTLIELVKDIQGRIYMIKV